MADRYWVGGAATWDSTAGSKWALTSGGAGGEAVPTGYDDVYIDNYGGNIQVKATSSSVCHNLNFNDGTGGAFVGTYYSPNVGTSIWGSLTFSPKMVMTHSGAYFLMLGTGSGLTVTFNGNTSLTFGYMSFSADTGDYTVTDNYVNVYTTGKILKTGAGDLTFDGNIEQGDGAAGTHIGHTKGSITFGNGSVNKMGYFYSTGSVARTVNMGSSETTFSHTSSTLMSISGTNLTFNCGTSKMTFTGTKPSLIYNTNTEFYDLAINGDQGTFNFDGNNFTCHDLTCTPANWMHLETRAGLQVRVTGVCEYKGSTWAPFTLVSTAGVTSPTVDTHAPATFITPITLSCSTSAACDNVYAQINDRVIALVNTSGNDWSKEIYAGYFGACTDAAVYFMSRTDAGVMATASDPSTITIPAASGATATLLTEIDSSLTTAGLTAEVSLVGEEEIGSEIRSLIKISVDTYDVDTIDAIRTAVATSYSGWAGTVTSVEYSAPVSATKSIVIFKMLHS